ncbi:MAG TPA: MBL fold metallo-hydrolase [Burkholderiales bacterium]|nr:MBL fold metallo-hydrolase [Burkholderiales bacterium]
MNFRSPSASVLLLLAASAALAAWPAHAQDSPARVTILYDAFGKPSTLKRGWGYSAFVEYGGRRILFDTGGNLDDFAANAAALGVDLSRLDFVVLTHRHGDHTSGLHQVLKVNPSVRIYTPAEGANFDTPTGPALVNVIKRRVETAPGDMHYFDGKYPERFASGSPWPGAKFTQIRAPTEVLPGFWLFATLSEIPGTREMNEVSMAVRTPQGLALMVGCSHPGIEKVMEVASKIEPRIYTVFGGFHLVDIPDSEVSSMVGRFHDKWKLERAAAGHCTGEFAFSEFNRIFGSKFDHAGVGSVIALPR